MAIDSLLLLVTEAAMIAIEEKERLYYSKHRENKTKGRKKKRKLQKM